jgi:hypothetical protein
MYQGKDVNDTLRPAGSGHLAALSRMSLYAAIFKTGAKRAGLGMRKAKSALADKGLQPGGLP